MAYFACSESYKEFLFEYISYSLYLIQKISILLGFIIEIVCKQKLVISVHFCRQSLKLNA